ncbi:hypothetical protein M5K25_000848 [Dendrobium thyrsiflorum]|uniref:OVATE domain-containing protein n=1 Tax=Dendrobium thyrsiflorum TaxID=117978 RepID=A0ABD0W793_DENTH
MKNIDTLDKMKSSGESFRSLNWSSIIPSQVEEEEACRSFESYLVEMIVEEGKVRVLMDVEELFHCWNSLTSPLFIELVSTFYGELCRDLFSYQAAEESLKVSYFDLLLSSADDSFFYWFDGILISFSISVDFRRLGRRDAYEQLTCVEGAW